MEPEVIGELYDRDSAPGEPHLQTLAYQPLIDAGMVQIVGPVNDQGYVCRIIFNASLVTKLKSSSSSGKHQCLTSSGKACSYRTGLESSNGFFHP